jgi:hypothetical protein
MPPTTVRPRTESAGGAGGPLTGEELVNVLAMHLIRHTLVPRQPQCGWDGRYRAVVEYTEQQQ